MGNSGKVWTHTTVMHVHVAYVGQEVRVAKHCKVPVRDRNGGEGGGGKVHRDSGGVNSSIKL